MTIAREPGAWSVSDVPPGLFPETDVGDSWPPTGRFCGGLSGRAGRRIPFYLDSECVFHPNFEKVGCDQGVPFSVDAYINTLPGIVG